jgi:hypothetical protein
MKIPVSTQKIALFFFFFFHFLRVMNLLAFVARAARVSRRGALELSQRGHVLVNGSTPDAARIDPQRDTVTLRGRRLHLPAPVTFALHKPLGVAVTLASSSSAAETSRTETRRAGPGSARGHVSSQSRSRDPVVERAGNRPGNRLLHNHNYDHNQSPNHNHNRNNSRDGKRHQQLTMPEDAFSCAPAPGALFLGGDPDALVRGIASMAAARPPRVPDRGPGFLLAHAAPWALGPAFCAARSFMFFKNFFFWSVPFLLLAQSAPNSL